jgi:hypothetical protein
MRPYGQGITRGNAAGGGLGAGGLGSGATTQQQREAQRLERERSEREERERLERAGLAQLSDLSEEQREEINEAVSQAPLGFGGHPLQSGISVDCYCLWTIVSQSLRYTQRSWQSLSCMSMNEKSE